MPKLLTTPFASEATSEYRTDVQNSTGAEPNSATYEQGFPPVTMEKIANGGKPPKGSDLNGVLYDITDNLVGLTKGARYGFNEAYATAIGGYPLGAVLRLDNGIEVESEVDSNSINPNVDMTGWKLAVSDNGIVTFNGQSQRELNTIFKSISPNNVHKTINNYGLDKTVTAQTKDAFSDSVHVEVKPEKYPDLLNNNDKAYSFGLTTPKAKSKNVINVVDNADQLASVSSGNATAQRWDLALAYAQKTGTNYHPFPSGFYIMPDMTNYYVWHKPDTGYNATLIKKTMSGVVVSEVSFPDTAPQGETFTILNDKMYVGGRMQDPRFHIYDTTAGTESDYFLWGGVTFSSRQFAYLDPLNQKRVIVFARKSGIGFGIFEYDLDVYTTTEGIKTLTLQKELAIPDFDETIDNIQGFTAIGQTAYLITEVIGVGIGQKTKRILTYRLTDGKLYDVKQFNPNGVYRNNAYYGNATSLDANYESEGLCAQVNSSRGKHSVDLYAGLLTGNSADTSTTKYRFLVFKSSIGGQECMTPVVQGLPVRGGNTTISSAGGYVQQYYITLQKINGTWVLQQDNYENALGLMVAQNCTVETINNQQVLVIYIFNVFLARLFAKCELSVFTYQAKVDRGSFGGNTGGATSSKQIIVFADNAGGLVSPSSLADGTRLEVSLTVISG